jgi:hypothetical protein
MKKHLLILAVLPLMAGCHHVHQPTARTYDSRSTQTEVPPNDPCCDTLPVPDVASYYLDDILPQKYVRRRGVNPPAPGARWDGRRWFVRTGHARPADSATCATHDPGAPCWAEIWEPVPRDGHKYGITLASAKLDLMIADFYKFGQP